MKLKNIFFTVFLLINLSFFAQNTTTSASKKTASIYTVSNLLDSKNDFSAINKKLKLNNFNFTFVTIIDNDFNTYSIDLNNIYRAHSDFINDDLKRRQNKNLLKGFLLKNDPTRWNLWCPSPLCVQPTE